MCISHRFSVSLPHLIPRDGEDYMYSVDACLLPAFTVMAVLNIYKIQYRNNNCNLRDYKIVTSPAHEHCLYETEVALNLEGEWKLCIGLGLISLGYEDFFIGCSTS